MRRRIIALAAAVLSTGPVAHCQLHFASIGNWGSGGRAQEAVANTLKSSAKSNQISFIVSPGSNFVQGGVEDLDDSAWTSQFAKPFKGTDMNVPFFTVLGQADWQGNFTALADRSAADYAATTSAEGPLPKWTLPNWWYHYTQHFSDATNAGAAVGGVDVSIGLIFVDTFILSRDFTFQNISRLHWDGLRETLNSAGKIFDWTVVVGDAALISSGASKGNKELRDSLGKLLHDTNVDVYISGNDYDMEIIEDGPLVHINCGAGSGADRSYRRKVKGSVAYFAKPGFCHHIVTKDGFSTQFINGIGGEALHNYTQTRGLRSRSVVDRFRLYKNLPEIRFIPVPPFGQTRPKEDDWFLKVFGTIGLMVAAYLAFVLLAATVTRVQKEGS